MDHSSSHHSSSTDTFNGDDSNTLHWKSVLQVQGAWQQLCRDRDGGLLLAESLLVRMVELEHLTLHVFEILDGLMETLSSPEDDDETCHELCQGLVGRGVSLAILAKAWPDVLKQHNAHLPTVDDELWKRVGQLFFRQFVQ